MSKIRIYELARELGVDNRVVIAKAVELGFQGKSSHSHSLEGDEADQIRRALIRQAVGENARAEVITTRVEKTGNGPGTIVEERRRGNVIMRRRQAGSESSRTEIVSEAPQVVSVSSSPQVTNTKWAVEEKSILEDTASHSAEKVQAEALFHTKEPGQVREEAKEEGISTPSSHEVLSAEVEEVQAQEQVETYQEKKAHQQEGASQQEQEGNRAPSLEQDEALEGVEGENESSSLPSPTTPQIESPRIVARSITEWKRLKSGQSEEQSSVAAVNVDEGQPQQGESLNAEFSATAVVSQEGIHEDASLAGSRPEEISTNDLVEERIESQQHAKVDEEKLIKAEESDTSTMQRPIPQEVAASPVSPVQEEQLKKQIGPRVLGRMELPTRKNTRVVEMKKGGNGATPGAPTPSATFVAPAVKAPTVVEDDDELEKKGKKSRSKKRELSRADLVDYNRGGDARRGKGKDPRFREADKKADPQENKVQKVTKKAIKLGESILVGELAKQMNLKVGEVIGKLMQLGVMATINQAIDKDTATIIADELGYQVESTEVAEETLLGEEQEDTAENLEPRSPVVTVMGHVDHGKTSLLDTIRKASVAAKEHGGITQHIGAYSVTVEGGKAITFIDTPGHAAFTQMRARGAKVTDIVILVVAADDGVMPQTVEAINHAKAAEVPIIVAVNKVDKPDANPDKIKQQLLEFGLQPEEWGGDTMYCPVSALKGTGISSLLDGVLVQAEVLELKANPNRRAKGTLIESRQEKGRGTVATVLVQQGTLHVGDIFVAGAEFGRIRSMISPDGERLTSAGPSFPVEITGLNGVPVAGDDFIVVENDSIARQIAEKRQEKIAQGERALASGPISFEEFSKRAAQAQAVELNLVLKTDVHGSLEALRDALERLTTGKVRVRVLHSGVGGITENDIQLAIASKAIVIGFGVRAEPRAVTEAERSSIEIRFYRVIYEVIDDVKKAMAGLLAPIKQEVALGRAEVRDTFSVSKIGTIAGSYVLDGTIKRGSLVRVLRDNRVIYEGKMGSLRRFKEDVKQVNSGYECGIGIENFNDVKVGDVLEIFEMHEVAQSID